MAKEIDTFRVKTSWITQITLDKPYEINEEDTLCVLTASDGFEIKTPMFPDSRVMELFEHAHVKVSEEDVVRTINSQTTRINDVRVRIKDKGKIIEYRSFSSKQASDNHRAVASELESQGYVILKEETERCEKEKCTVW